MSGGFGGEVGGAGLATDDGRSLRRPPGHRSTGFYRTKRFRRMADALDFQFDHVTWLEGATEFQAAAGADGAGADDLAGVQGFRMLLGDEGDGRYGWGLYRTPHGGRYLVSGGEAVKIALGSGKRFRLGTNQPQRLAQILLAVKRVPPHP